MIYSNLSKIIKNNLKSNIRDIINNNEENTNNIKGDKFIEIINLNINNDKVIKYIIKIISFNIKTSKNESIKKKYYELFILLIKNFSREDTIKYLTNLLLFLQENINIYPIEIFFELILKNLEKIELKLFEILNGFCIHNIKKNEIKIQKEALLCYEKLINNYDNFIENKNEILKSFLDNIIFNLKIENINNKYQLLECLNTIVFVSKDKFEKYVELTVHFIKDNLFINDNNIKSITLNIINNIIQFNQEKILELKNELYNYFVKLLEDKSLDINIKSNILEILNKLNINYNENNIDNNEEIDNLIDDFLDKNGKEKNTISSQDIKNGLNEFLKEEEINEINIKNKIINKDLKIEINKGIDPNLNKIKSKRKYNKNKNAKVEIYFKKNPNLEKKIVKREYTPLNTYKRKIENHLHLFNDSSKIQNQKDKFISTYIDEDEYLNPIKLWNNFDNINKSKKNLLKQIPNQNVEKIRIDKSINNSQINIINQSKEEPKLELIINEISKISEMQNFLAEKIILLEKNTLSQISYYDSKIEELENKFPIEEDLLDNNYKIIYPSNVLNEKLISFLNNENSDESIYYLLGITENQIIEIDNNLIGDVVNKLIDFLEQGIYIHECISFIKKVFIRNKMRFQLNTIKRLFSSFDKLLLNKKSLSNEDSLDISLILSFINIDKI